MVPVLVNLRWRFTFTWLPAVTFMYKFSGGAPGSVCRSCFPLTFTLAYMPGASSSSSSSCSLPLFVLTVRVCWLPRVSVTWTEQEGRRSGWFGLGSHWTSGYNEIDTQYKKEDNCMLYYTFSKHYNFWFCFFVSFFPHLICTYKIPEVVAITFMIIRKLYTTWFRHIITQNSTWQEK